MDGGVFFAAQNGNPGPLEASRGRLPCVPGVPRAMKLVGMTGFEPATP